MLRVPSRQSAPNVKIVRGLPSRTVELQAVQINVTVAGGLHPCSARR